MSGKIHLTFPRTHSDKDIEFLFQEYGKRFPEKLADWIDVEKRLSEQIRAGEDVEDSPQNPLRQITREFFEFMKEYCTWESTFASTTAASHIRSKVISLSEQRSS
jgi:hypothetical protein